MTRQSDYHRFDVEPADWMREASCLDYEPGPWDASSTPTETRLAIEICQSCPVKWRCLAFAIDTHSDHGVFGATTGDQRELMRRNTARRKRRAS